MSATLPVRLPEPPRIPQTINVLKQREAFLKHQLRKALLAGGTVLMTLAGGAFALAGTAWSQEATFVMGTNEVGAPTYNPVKATMLNAATSLIFDRLVVQDADQSFHPHLAESWEEAP